MPKSIAFIINPAAGFGKTKKRIKTIIKHIKSVAPDAKIVQTHHPLHAISLTKQLIEEGYLRLVVVGGDGTLNEVVNGYFNQDGSPCNKMVSIAMVPSGSGSDFFRSLHQEHKLHEIIKMAVTREALPTDVGLVHAHDAHGHMVKRYFINVSSVGLSGLVAGFMKTVNRSLGPTMAYFMATLQAIRALKPATIMMTSLGFEKTIEKCSLLSFANGQYFGSGMKIAPHAKLDDGLFDVVGIKNLGPLFFIMHGWRIYQGRHLELDNTEVHRLKDCVVKTSNKEPVYVETDGELFAELPATYSLCHKAILIVR